MLVYLSALSSRLFSTCSSRAGVAVHVHLVAPRRPPCAARCARPGRGRRDSGPRGRGAPPGRAAARSCPRSRGRRSSRSSTSRPRCPSWRPMIATTWRMVDRRGQPLEDRHRVGEQRRPAGRQLAPEHGQELVLGLVRGAERLLVELPLGDVERDAQDRGLALEGDDLRVDEELGGPRRPASGTLTSRSAHLALGVQEAEQPVAPLRRSPRNRAPACCGRASPRASTRWRRTAASLIFKVPLIAQARDGHGQRVGVEATMNRRSLSRSAASARVRSVMSVSALRMHASPSNITMSAERTVTRSSPLLTRKRHSMPRTVRPVLSRRMPSSRWTGSTQSPSSTGVRPRISSRVYPEVLRKASLASRTRPSLRPVRQRMVGLSPKTARVSPKPGSPRRRRSRPRRSAVPSRSTRGSASGPRATARRRRCRGRAGRRRAGDAEVAAALAAGNSRLRGAVRPGLPHPCRRAIVARDPRCAHRAPRAHAGRGGARRRRPAPPDRRPPTEGTSRMKRPPASPRTCSTPARAARRGRRGRAARTRR